MAGSGSMIWLTMVTLTLAALLVGLIAWFVRRNMQGVAADSGMRVLAVQALGARERVVVVQAFGRVLMLGHTPQQINLITELEPSEVQGLISRAPSADFANRLSGFLRKGKP